MKFVLVIVAILAALEGTTSASTRAEYYDAVVVEAEGRSEGDRPPPRAINPKDCLLPPSQGPCRGYFQYYYYDANANKCKKFTYSGCGGNNNKFVTAKECEAACSGAKDREEAEEEKEYLQEQQTQYSPCSWQKPPKCDAGCSLINDPAKDCPRCECSQEVRRQVCSQRPSKGNCRALLRRWGYDSQSGQCVEFNFGGCSGNANNFNMRQQCMDTCAGN